VALRVYKLAFPYSCFIVTSFGSTSCSGMLFWSILRVMAFLRLRVLAGMLLNYSTTSTNLVVRGS